MMPRTQQAEVQDEEYFLHILIKFVLPLRPDLCVYVIFVPLYLLQVAMALELTQQLSQQAMEGPCTSLVLLLVVMDLSEEK